MQLSTCASLYILIALLQCPVQAEDEAYEQSHSTSVEGMVKLVLLEAKLVENLGRYANKLDKKLQILKSVIPQLQAESKTAMNQREAYVSNPLKAFSLIRRLHEDWHEWKLFVEEPVAPAQVAFINHHIAQLPSPKDLEEACRAMHRLYDVYNLTVTDMAMGLLNGKQYNASLNALDSYALGEYMYRRHVLSLGREWFAESTKWLREHTLPTPKGADHPKTLHFFASEFAKKKFYSIALPLIDRSLELANLTGDTDVFVERMQIEELSRASPELKPIKRYTTDYARGCSGQFAPRSNLLCEYKSSTSAFLRLAPLKMEVLLSDPSIVVFHDVLSPRETEELQELARPLLTRTYVYKSKNEHIVQNTRTSKGTWLNRSLNSHTKRIKRRIMDMTELNLQDADLLQVMNYGLGGHNAPHTDFFNTTEVHDLNSPTGDRIATVLFYLTDVEQGGGTVFPKLRQAFRAKRGSALFWYNLHSNGTGDYRTLHGGCPVLVGSKWIMTQWIYERSQLFTRPCLRGITN